MNQIKKLINNKFLMLFNFDFYYKVVSFSIILFLHKTLIQLA